MSINELELQNYNFHQECNFFIFLFFFKYFFRIFQNSNFLLNIQIPFFPQNTKNWRTNISINDLKQQIYDIKYEIPSNFLLFFFKVSKFPNPKSQNFITEYPNFSIFPFQSRIPPIIPKIALNFYSLNFQVLRLRQINFKNKKNK